MDYSKTVNLPKTSFSMKGNLPIKEPEIISFWQKNNIYKKLLNKRKVSSKGKFILHDGPPYANGHIHLGTALNKILKDIVIKSKTNEGYYCPFVPGWDCHGLPIEQQLLKELKTDKDSIEVLEFRKKAAEFAQKFVEIQKEEFKRLGVFADWENSYLTLAPYYESALISVFSELVKRNFIYRKKKPVYWCPTCQTALADAEVEYADHISPSVFVKFPVIKFPSAFSTFHFSLPTSVLIWTTTPWTLPANVALAFNPDEDYSIIRVSDEFFVVAQKRLRGLVEKTSIKEYEVIEVYRGAEFESVECRNPVIERSSVGVLAGFVSVEDGTGIVHIAPGHGIEDYQVGLEYKLPIVSPVNDSGVFTKEAGEFAGHKVFAANHLIVEKLRSSGQLLHSEQITHSYPHCWRCKRAIIFRATEQWFLDVNSSNLKEKLLDEIKKVKWIPEYGEKRIVSMVIERPDWCLSRQRLWGTPIPVFYCQRCNTPILNQKIIDGISTLFKQYGSDVWYEKGAGEILESIGCKIECPVCKNITFRKENDIFDVWFDSGVSSFAVLNTKNFPSLNSAPADVYLEGSDQHRGWFQTSLIPSVAIRNSAPYKAVLTHGFVVDGEGKKMSKSLGNIISPDEIIKVYGADILRLWVASSNYTEDIRISKEILNGLVEVYRKIRNTLRYILGNISDMLPDKKIEYDKRREIDKYIFNKFLSVAKICESAYENYEFHKVVYYINNFCVNELSSLYFDIAKDCLYCDDKKSDERISLQSTLDDIFIGLVKYISPLLSFTAEDAWICYQKDRNLQISESVFLYEFPEYKKQQIDAGMLDRWEKLLLYRRNINIEIEKIRASGIVGSNQECEVIIKPKDESEKNFLIEFTKVVDLKKVFIVSDLQISDVSSDGEEHIIVNKSSRKKCARCWNYREDVSKNPSGLEVCGRCYDVLSKMKVPE